MNLRRGAFDRLAGPSGMAAVRRASEVQRLVRDDGSKALAQRIVRHLYRRWGVNDLEFPLRLDDVADSTRFRPLEPAGHLDAKRPLRVGWVLTPPSAGSGGHTTIFRMVDALERAGHTCVLYLYDRYGGDSRRHEQILRKAWPWLRSEVRDVVQGVADVDACVATSWDTAHVLARRPGLRTRRLYFVQDYEPFFYPRGTRYALAEDSYRFGFRTVAVGHMVADQLRSEVGVESVVAPFGVDSSVYHLTNTSDRSGVVFYTKPEVARRGYVMGVLALQQFHRRHPEQEIHVLGSTPGALPFPARHHGRLTPRQLNELYNDTMAGFAMSFTNISLVAEEMLAAGTVPVINDSALARVDLQNPYARWALPTPGALADELCDVVEGADPTGRAVRASSSVRADDWRPAQATMVAAVERAVYGPSHGSADSTSTSSDA